MQFQIKKASKSQSRARVALMGPPGSGKTFSALNMAQHLGARVILIDTERGSASKYADEFDFEVLELDTFNPKTYIAAIAAAEEAGADVIIIDSLSHAWIGKDGALEMVDKAAASSSNKNSFTAWKEVTPLHNQLVETILRAKAHVFVTLRTKTEYVIEANERGRLVPRKVGLAALQRDGIEYEFDICGVLDTDSIRRAITHSSDRIIYAIDLAEHLPENNVTTGADSSVRESLEASGKHAGALSSKHEQGGLEERVKRFKGNVVKETLAAHNGNRSRAASSLGVSRPKLHRLLKELEQGS
jgi:nucleoside-triphosphatase THEP1